MGVMYDAAYPDNIPADAPIVAGYINGKYTWTQEQWDRFSGIKLRMAVYIPGETVPMDGEILDVEAEDAPDYEARLQAAEWAADRLNNGVRPVIYTSISGLQYLGGWNGVFYWIADPDNPTPHIYNYPNCVATQWSYPGGYDVSETIATWPVAPASVPPPYRGVKYVFIPSQCNGLDSNGNGYCDVAAVPDKVVAVRINTQDPSTNGYPPYPKVVGTLDYGGMTRVVFEGGLPGQSFAFTVISDQ